MNAASDVVACLGMRQRDTSGAPLETRRTLNPMILRQRLYGPRFDLETAYGGTYELHTLSRLHGERRILCVRRSRRGRDVALYELWGRHRCADFGVPDVSHGSANQAGADHWSSATARCPPFQRLKPARQPRGDGAP